MTEVTFCVRLAEDDCVNEQEIASNYPDLCKALLEAEAFEGAIIIRMNDAPEVRIEDEMDAMIQNVCFLSIPKLMAEEHVVVRYFSYYGYLRFDPEGDNVLISGDFVPAIRVPREDLISALHSCGRRYIDLYRRLAEEDSSYEAIIEHLEAQETIAKRAFGAD